MDTYIQKENGQLESVSTKGVWTSQFISTGGFTNFIEFLLLMDLKVIKNALIKSFMSLYLRLLYQFLNKLSN